MTSTVAVLTLMIGAVILGCLAVFFYYQNILTQYKKKLSHFNTALVTLQEERSSIKRKANNLYLENATQTAEIENLQEMLEINKKTIESLEMDNNYLKKEYVLLENRIYHS
jgi:peptidoglycan hydrolase CwlO-like protein